MTARVPKAHVVLRDRPVLDVLDLALRFVVTRGKPFALVSLVVVVPGWLASAAIAREMGAAWGWLAALALASIAQTPVTLLASRLVFEEETSVRDVLGASARLLPLVLVRRVVQAAALTIAYSMLLLPGIWASAVFVFGPEILILERGGLRATLSRAQRMSSVAFTDAIFADIVLGILLVASILLGEWVGRAIAGDVLQFRLPPGLFDQGISDFALLGMWLTLPYRTTARLFVYLNVRTRTEGWDIQTRFAAIAARAASEAEA